MPRQDAERIHNAAHHWAWYRKVRVSTRKVPCGEGLQYVRVILTHLNRDRLDVF